jgi:hypothetical protein
MARIARTVTFSFVVLLVGFFLPKALSNPAHGQTGCSAASLSGPYGIQGSGTIFGTPSAFVGTFVFDGQGKETGSLVLNVGGGIDHIGQVTGTYKVDGSCDGTLVIHTIHHNPPVAHYHDVEMVVVDGGKEVLFSLGGPKDSPSGSPPPGEVFSGVLERQ